MDQQVRQGLAALWVVALWVEVSGAVWAVWAAALAAVWVAGSGTEWAGLSAWSLAKRWSHNPGPRSYSSNPVAPGATSRHS